jgi:hypothetical protein
MEGWPEELVISKRRETDAVPGNAVSVEKRIAPPTGLYPQLRVPVFRSVAGWGVSDMHFLL